MNSLQVAGVAILKTVTDWSVKTTHLPHHSTDGHVNNLMSLK